MFCQDFESYQDFVVEVNTYKREKNDAAFSHTHSLQKVLLF